MLVAIIETTKEGLPPCEAILNVLGEVDSFVKQLCGGAKVNQTTEGMRQGWATSAANAKQAISDSRPRFVHVTRPDQSRTVGCRAPGLFRGSNIGRLWSHRGSPAE